MALIIGTANNEFVHVFNDGLTPPAGYVDREEATVGNDIFDGSSGGDDWVNLGGGNDRFDFFGGLTLADRLNGGAGYDVLEIGEAGTIAFGSAALIGIEEIVLHTSRAVYNYTFHDANVAAGATMRVVCHEIASIDFTAETNAGRIVVLGSYGPDTIRGGGATDELSGGDGNDFIAGGAGTDALTGGTGDDYLRGEAGNDTLDGGQGADTLEGGVGNDVYMTSLSSEVYESANQGFDRVISDASFSLATLSYVERLELSGAVPGFLRGNNFANQLVGNAGSNTMEGFAGGDTILGLGGRDTIVGGLGRDIIAPGLERDTVRWTAVAESTGAGRDSVSEFVFSSGGPYERLDFPIVPTAVRQIIASGTLREASFDSDLQIAVNAANLGANQAVLFDPSGGDLNVAGHIYLIVDANGQAGYQAGQDYVVQFTSWYGTLSLANFI